MDSVNPFIAAIQPKAVSPETPKYSRVSKIVAIAMTAIAELYVLRSAHPILGTFLVAASVIAAYVLSKLQGKPVPVKPEEQDLLTSKLLKSIYDARIARHEEPICNCTTAKFEAEDFGYYWAGKDFLGRPYLAVKIFYNGLLGRDPVEGHLVEVLYKEEDGKWKIRSGDQNSNQEHSIYILGNNGSEVDKKTRDSLSILFRRYSYSTQILQGATDYSPKMLLSCSLSSGSA